MFFLILDNNENTITSYRCPFSYVAVHNGYDTKMKKDNEYCVVVVWLVGIVWCTGNFTVVWKSVLLQTKKYTNILLL